MQNLILAESSIGRKVGMDAYIQKGVSLRFGFDVLELRNFKLLVKNKATGTPQLGVLYAFISSRCLVYPMLMLVQNTRRGAFSVARFGKKGNAKALTRGTSNGIGSHVFFVYMLTLNKSTKDYLGVLVIEESV